MYLSRQPQYRGPHLQDAAVTFGGTSIRIGVRHTPGRESILKPTPARITALAHDHESDEWASVALVFDVFGSEETGDLRVGVVSFSAEGVAGQPVSTALLARLDPEDLLVVGVMAVGLSTNKAMTPTRELLSLSEHEARAFLVPGGSSDMAKAEARALDDERERIAHAWWDCKLEGSAVGLAVAKARGEEAPGSKPAQNRAHQYVNDLRRRGVLARVGQERGIDVAAYGVEPKRS